MKARKVRVSRTTPEAMRGVYTCAGVIAGDVNAVVTAWTADGRIELEIHDGPRYVRATFTNDGDGFIIERCTVPLVDERS